MRIYPAGLEAWSEPLSLYILVYAKGSGKYLPCIGLYSTGCSVEYCSSIIKDCDDYWSLNHRTSGVYRVIPNGMTRGCDVYCEMTTEGGWLVG